MLPSSTTVTICSIFQTQEEVWRQQRKRLSWNNWSFRWQLLIASLLDRRSLQTLLQMKSWNDWKTRMGKEVDMDFPGSDFNKLPILMHLLLTLYSNYLNRILKKLKTEENSHYCLPSHNDSAKVTLVTYPVQARVLLINSEVTDITAISHTATLALLWPYLFKKLISLPIVQSSAFKEGQGLTL